MLGCIRCQARGRGVNGGGVWGGVEVVLLLPTAGVLLLPTYPVQGARVRAAAGVTCTGSVLPFAMAAVARPSSSTHVST